MLSTILRSPEGCEAFAASLDLLPSPSFVGATAGVRHALETGAVTDADVAALRGMLPVGCVLCILSPLDEAFYELRALHKHVPKEDAECAMISMVTGVLRV